MKSTGGAESSVQEEVASVRPTVTQATTNQAAGLQSLIIGGTGFDPTAANDSVLLKDGSTTINNTVISASATSLTLAISPLTLPTVAGPLTAVVTVGPSGNINDLNSGLPVQVATIAPAVTSSTASLAANAGSILINGSGFAAPPQITRSCLTMARGRHRNRKWHDPASRDVRQIAAGRGPA